MMAKVYATKIFTFDSAHKLINYVGDCARVHGHTYKLEVTLMKNMGGFENPEHKAEHLMVMNFGTMKEIVQEVILSKVDHNMLNDVYLHTTAESMVVQMFRSLQSYLSGINSLASVHRIRLWETPTSYAEYLGE